MNIKDFILGYLIGKQDGGGGASIEPLTVTENGEYSEEGVAYSPVTVNVAGGGGGGLEYEEGTWTPTEDVAQHSISFANAHENPPFYYAIVDATGANQETLNSNMYIFFTDNTQIGGRINITASSYEYGRATAGYKTSATSMSTNNKQLTAKATSGTSSAENNVRFWASENHILAYCGSGTCYWRTGRTYKWIAVFAPAPEA